MIDPALSLIFACALIALTLLIIWPNKGLMAKVKRFSHSNRRVLMEDALKHIYQCQRHHIPCTFQSLSGALLVHPDKVTKLLFNLESLKLITHTKKGLELTSEGTAYALRIIRIHRLWERYLSEETSIPEATWHSEAEIQEHKFSEEEANKISHQLGHPSYDPHGDPIPTAAGELPPTRGIPLTRLSKHQIAKVIHIEDEPESIYQEIISKGIQLGIQIEMLVPINSNIHILVGNNETELAPFIAENITVTKISEDQKIVAAHETLLSLDSHEKGTVVAISRSCRGQQRRRLMDLGVVPGTTISRELESLTGEPVAYNIRGTMIALRNNQARHILIKKTRKTN